MLQFTKKHYYLYYKKLDSLKSLQLKSDGFIHGDIFVDNTLFEAERIALFDFIDGGCGAFSFDVGVAVMSFNPHKKRAFTQLFLQTYNQHAPKKVTKRELHEQMQNAAKLYALLRINKYKTTTKAKLLLKTL